MTATYAEITKQIAELQRAAEDARRNEIAEAKAKISAIMQEFGLSTLDLVGGKAKSDKIKAAVPAKYKNPETGELWTGRGRAPRWLDGKEKNDFLISE